MCDIFIIICFKQLDKQPKVRRIDYLSCSFVCSIVRISNEIAP